MTPAVVLRPGRDRSLRRRHPWVFSGAIERVEGVPESGATVLVRSADGVPLALAAWSPSSQIRARVWSFDLQRQIDADFFRARIERAAAFRRALRVGEESNAYRVVHAESDGLPGIVVDRYADVLAVQFLSAGAERWRETILDALADELGCEAIFERSDADVRNLEGLPPRSGFVRGNRDASRCAIVENGLHFRVDLERGQKTGFFLDQRDNRRHIRDRAQDRRVLDCFCYSGGFSIAALAGGAKQVLSVDSSAAALDLARENLSANAIAGDRAELRQADVFEHLRALRDRRAQFELIVLDPPKFAPTAAQAQGAARAYKDINLLALKLLGPGGLLATFSCSGGISMELFQSIVAGAAVDAGVDARIVHRYGASADHPVALEFPEGDYLKGLLLRRP